MTASQHAKPLTEWTPAEIDTVLAPLESATASAFFALATVEQRLTKDHDQIADLDPESYTAKYTLAPRIEQYEAQVPGLQVAWQRAQEAEQPYHLEYERRGGWTRAYLVDNSNGHVHKSRHCATCFPTTRYFWLTEFSGRDESEIVEAAGETACTECYPSAPVDVLKRKTTIEAPSRREARLAREAKAAAKAAKDAATGISNPDGTHLRGKWGVIKTERTAQIELVDIIVSHRAWGYDEHLSTQERIVAALAHKRGQTPDQVRADIEPKVLARIKRDSR